MGVTARAGIRDWNKSRCESEGEGCAGEGEGEGGGGLRAGCSAHRCRSDCSHSLVASAVAASLP